MRDAPPGFAEFRADGSARTPLQIVAHMADLFDWACCIVLLWVVLIYLNERYHLFSVDQFSSTATKWIAYVWLGLFLFLLTFLIVGSSRHPPTAKDLAKVPFYSLFTLHAILLTFLVGWWLLTRRPPLGTFLNIPRERAGEAIMTGFAVGVGGWILTIMLA